jgi:ABC-type cobalt transport system substrate-binding protein
VSPTLDSRLRYPLTMNNLDQTESPLAGTPANPKITTNSGEGHPAWNDPVYFPEWHEILALAPLDAQTQARFAKAIIYYLGYCRDSRERASIAGAKRYLETGPNRGSIDREALRWFFVTYRQRHEAGHPTQPVPVIVEPPRSTPMSCHAQELAPRARWMGERRVGTRMPPSFRRR